MKKLKKLSLSELKTEMPVMGKEEAAGMTGGTQQINGATWYTLQEYHDAVEAQTWTSGYVIGIRGMVVGTPFSADEALNMAGFTQGLGDFEGSMGSAEFEFAYSLNCGSCLDPSVVVDYFNSQNIPMTEERYFENVMWKAWHSDYTDSLGGSQNAVYEFFGNGVLVFSRYDIGSSYKAGECIGSIGLDIYDPIYF